MKIINERKERGSKGYYDELINAFENDIDVLMDCKSLEDIDQNSNLFKAYSSKFISKQINYDLEDGMSFKRSILDMIKFYDEQIEDLKEGKLRTDAQVAECEKLFPKMLLFIKNNFENVQVKDQYKIYFDASQFNRVQDMVKFITKEFNLKSGMFGFESSFTTHDAYTPETNAELKIGLTRDGTPTECKVLFVPLLKYYDLPYDSMND